MFARWSRSLALLLIACSASAASRITLPAQLSFERNAGQAGPRVQFLARSPRYRVLLSPDEVVFSLRGSAQGEIHLKFVGSQAASLEGLRQLPGVVNYFFGPKPDKWLRSIPTYERVRRREVYRGVDAVFYGTEGQLKYDLIVAPGADVSQIALAFDGAKGISIDDAGDLVLGTAAGNLVQHKPLIYQERDGERQFLDGHYAVRNDGEVVIVIPRYDRRRPLVIDPVLLYAVSVSGSGPDQVNGVTVDAQGNTYITGATSSQDFPALHSFQSHLDSANLLRIDNGGASQTPLRGVVGTQITSLAVDPAKAATVYAGTEVGLFKSIDAGAHWDAIGGGLPRGMITALQIDASNSAVVYAGVEEVDTLTADLGLYKTTDGGITWRAMNNGFTGGQYKLEIDALYLNPNRPSVLFAKTPDGRFRSNDGGATWTSYAFNFQTLGFDPSSPGRLFASTDNFIHKSTDGGNTWTPLNFLAGSSFVSSLVVDPFQPNTLYAGTGEGVQKSTDGGLNWQWTNFKGDGFEVIPDPITPNTVYAGGYSGVFKSVDGGMTWYSVASPKIARPLVALAAGTAPAGTTLYVGTRVTSDIFVSKLDPLGHLVYSTFIGGAGSDKGSAIAVDASGAAYVTGTTESAPDFPVTPGALPWINPTYGSFVLKLGPRGDSLIYSAIPTDGNTTPTGIAVDAEGNAHITGFTQGNLAITPGAYWTTPPSPGPGGGLGIGPGFTPSDAFVLKFNSAGSALIYGTYLNHASGGGNAIAIDPAGHGYVTGFGFIDKINGNGSALIYSAHLNATGKAITIDSQGNAYVTGDASSTQLTPTPGALNTVTASELIHAFVTKLDANGSTVFAALLGGESNDSGRGIAVDASGNIVVVGNTTSMNFPLRNPVQGAFSAQTGFLTKLDSSGSSLLLSTYVGDTRIFQVSCLALDSAGRPILCGSTLGGGTVLDAFVAKYDLTETSAVSLDTMRNSASQLGVPVSPGEIITVTGSGFGSGTQLLFDNIPALLLSTAAGKLTAIAPYALEGKNVTRASIESAGQPSDPVWIRVVPAAPGIYTVDGNGIGQALAFNEDGTPNSLTHPAAQGSLITFFATGVGKTIPPGTDGVIHRRIPGLPVLPFELRIDTYYVSGPEISMGSQPGFPGDVVKVQGRIPTADFGPQKTVSIQISVNGFRSRDAVFIAVRPR